MTEHVSGDGDSPLRFDHYEVIRRIGRGAMGMVYLARDVRIGRQVALKTLRTDHLPDPDSEEAREFLARFKREALVCGSLVHPNIVTLYEVGYSDDQVRYLAMEFVEGESLMAILRRESRLGVEPASRIILDILSALHYAHERGVVHRDIKPANVLIDRQGHAKIADFGVARSVREGISHVTKAGDLLGTPYYMAPEQIEGRGVDIRADQFSVGVLFYEVLSGSRPFSGKEIMNVLYDVVNHRERPLRSVAPDLPRWCEQFVSRLLEKDPEDRFVSAFAAAEELQRLLSAGGVARTDSLPDPASVSRALAERSPEETPTLPIQSPHARGLRGLRRPVSMRVAATVLAVLLAALVVPAAWMTIDILDDSPTVVIPVEQQEAYERKREMMEEARVLMEAGAYGSAVERYEEVLAEFPDTPSAERGRDEAMTRIFQLRSRRTIP